MAGKDKTTKKTSKARSKAVSKKKSSLLDDIISAAPVAAKETKERYIVEGFEDLASRLRTQRVQLESLETEHKQDKKTLANAMRKIRLELECSGQYTLLCSLTLMITIKTITCCPLWRSFRTNTLRLPQMIS